MTTSPLQSVRNIGIISHIDAGKTTVSERILFYTGEIHKMGEVHEGLAVMDWMEQERERGITITATSTTCRWNDITINLIDTPGHIDFTIEVERSMRVLDGGVAIFSAVEGVQPQSESVWRQAERYGVPRICFVNKMDRIGAEYQRVLAQMADRLHARPVLMQLPVGFETSFSGVVDVLTGELVTFADNDLGSTVTRSPAPDDLAAEAALLREQVVEAAADFDDDIMASFLAGEQVATEAVKKALRKGVIACRIFPVFLGSALRNKGIQPLLNAVADYLPSPLDVPAAAATGAGGAVTAIPCDPGAPLAALAFKVLAEEGRKLTYIRIYAGRLKANAAVLNGTRGKFEKIARLYRMHSHRREQLDEASAGDIVAATGLKEALTGDTLCDPAHPVILAGIPAPEPVVSLAVEPRRAEDRESLPDALEKLGWEDPTFHVREDAETGQTILTGMGELHLEIVVDRLEREMGIQVRTSPPRVMYRETIAKRIERLESFRREFEGKVQAAEVLLRLAPLERGQGCQIVAAIPQEAHIPAEHIQAARESVQAACSGGAVTGYPMTDLRVEIAGITYDPAITTVAAVRVAAQRGLALAARDAGILLLEPVMALEVVTPEEAAGKVLGSLQQKRGRIEGIETREGIETIKASVPLAELFGYMTQLRSATKGRGTFTMEFSHFDVAPREVMVAAGVG